MKSEEFRLSGDEGNILLDVAEASVRHGLMHGTPLDVDIREFPPRLRLPGASFVTIHKGRQLRGCIGTVVPIRPLVSDVAENAYRAAFRDPRFPPLQMEEFPELNFDVAVLSPLEPIPFKIEEDVVRQLRPGVDGLMLEYGPYRGLLLPAVWDDLPDPASFVTHVKLKAGLPPNFWARDMKAYRFTTQKFARSGPT